MGSGESKPSIDSPEEIEKQLLKRQKSYEDAQRKDLEAESVLTTTPHEPTVFQEAGKIGAFMRTVDFANFNKTTSQVIKYLQVLDQKFRKVFWAQFRSFYRESGEASGGIDFRYPGPMM